MHSFWQDVRFGLRMLRKNPAFTFVAILTLAFGIGASTAIFSVVDTVLLRPLPFPHPSQLVEVSGRVATYDIPDLPLSYPDFLDLRSTSSSFSAMAAYRDSWKEFSSDDKPQRIENIEVSEDFFAILGMRPLYGRTFVASDMLPGSRAVLLGFPFWEERFGSDPNIVGKTITVDGQPHTVVGVMSAQAPLPYASQSGIFTPCQPSEKERDSRHAYYWAVIGRLKPGVTLLRANNELSLIGARLASAYPEAHKAWTLSATSLRQFLLGDARTPLTVLLCAVGFVLLIACANVSNLFLSRGWARRREFAIRTAMGASRTDLVRQLVVECLLIALAGGICALLVTKWSILGLRAILPPEIPRLEDLHVNTDLVWFTLGVSVFAALLSGVAPALLSARQDTNTVIKESSAGAGGTPSTSAHNLLRHLLVVGEIAIAIVLLLGATLALRSFGRLLKHDIGFRPDHLITMRMEFPKFRFANSGEALVFVQQILRSARALPDVESAATGMVFPLSDEIAESTFQTSDSTDATNEEGPAALVNRVSPDFFQTFGIPLLAGRDFNPADGNGSSLVFIVNESLARKYFGTIDVVGKRFSVNKESGHPVWGQIIGVSGNARQTGQDPAVEPRPEIYTSLYQSRDVDSIYLIVRTKTDPLLAASVIQDRIWTIDKKQPVADVQTLDTRIATANAGPRSQAMLLGIFGALGFALAVIGVYGVMNYLVSLRTREFGIRMAIGATPQQVLRSVIAFGLRITLAGVLIGVLCGFALTRFMSSMLFGIESNDSITFTAVPVALTLVAMAACYIPARRATRVDPVTALRYE
jgi:putative ABC transport system permease protein